MLAFIHSCGLSGIEGFPVDVEVNLAHGMPMFEIVGLPDASVKESRERVRAALKNSGDRKSTRLNSSHPTTSRMPSSA